MCASSFPSRIAKLAVLCGIVCGASISARAQLVSPDSPGSVAGTVADPTGAVIPQASVTASRRGSVSAAVLTDGLGRFSITGLAPGAYDIEARAAGFRTLLKQGVRVAPGTAQQLTLTLVIETDQQQVVVIDSRYQPRVERQRHGDEG